MNETLHFPVDIEHAGLRGAVLLAFLAAALLVCGLTTVVTPNLGVLIAGGVGLAAGVGAAALAERGLKGRWLSGRELHLDAGGVRLLRKSEIETALDAGVSADVLRWHFQSRKQRRVPKGWFVVAVALVADDERAIVLYTLLSPERFDTLPTRERFKALLPPAKTGSAAEDMRLAGEQRRLHEAEVRRWNSGAELTPDAFEAALKHIDTLFG